MKAMKKFLNLWIVIFSICGFFMFCAFIDAQDSFFGMETGYTIKMLELGILGIIGLSIYLVKKEKKRLAIVAMLLSISCVFFIIGYYSHPDRVYKRAVERVEELVELSLEYEINLKDASDKESKQIKIYLSRLNTELKARKLELFAAKIRRSGDPEYFRDSFFMYMCFMFGTISAVGAVCNFLMRKSK